MLSEIELRTAGVRVAQREFDRRLEVVAALREWAAGRLAPPDAGEEHVEEIREPARVFAETLEAERGLGLGVAIAPLLGGLLRRPLPVASERVVLLALLGVAENLVGLLDLLESFFGRLGVVGVGVGMPLARQFAIGRLDVFLGGRLRHAEDLVIVFVVHAVATARASPR